MEKLVDSWNSYSNYDFIVFPDHLYGIIYADASGKCFTFPWVSLALFFSTDMIEVIWACHKKEGSSRFGNSECHSFKHLLVHEMSWTNFFLFAKYPFSVFTQQRPSMHNKYILPALDAANEFTHTSLYRVRLLATSLTSKNSI